MDQTTQPKGPHDTTRCADRVRRHGGNGVRCEDTVLGYSVNRSSGHTRARTTAEHTTAEQTTHTRQEQHPKPPNEHLPQTLNNIRGV